MFPGVLKDNVFVFSWGIKLTILKMNDSVIIK
jgi:hypothetical protein